MPLCHICEKPIDMSRGLHDEIKLTLEIQRKVGRDFHSQEWKWVNSRIVCHECLLILKTMVRY